MSRRTRSDSPLLPETEALQALLEQATPVKETERIDTASALGRVLAEDLRAGIDVPALDNSAMDGYAFASRDIPAAGEICLRVTQRIAAGRPGRRLTRGTAARIFTGAPLPPGADTVVPQEQARRCGDRVWITGPPAPGRHVRRAGEDIRAGTTVLGAGTRLRPQELGLAAALGKERLPVYRRVRVAVLFTGDELTEPGTTPAPGGIYNSNRYTLRGLLQALGCETRDLGIVPDEPEATRRALATAAGQADLVLSSGGVSVGEEDHVKAAVQRIGRLELWRVAVKPGKPLAYGRIGKTHFIGLPGNPVSLFVTFCIFARPFLLKLQGCSSLAPAPIAAIADFERHNPVARREYLRARLERDASGQNRVTLHPHQGSGVLSSVVWANCLAVVPENATVERGQHIEVLPFADLLS